MSRMVQITLFIPKANHTFASTCELGLAETLKFHFIQLAFSIRSPEREVSHSAPVSEWRDEPHDPGAWLISDHYPVSAARRENQAFVLGFNCTARCSSSRLLTWLWIAGNVCHRGLAEAVRHFQLLIFSPWSLNEEGRTGEKGRGFSEFSGLRQGCH